MVTRREFLKTVGVGAAAIGCEGASSVIGGDAAAATDTEPTGADTSAADTTLAPPEDTAPSADTRVELGDTEAPPEPMLTPLRGDGSHPFHYIEHVVILQMENRSFDHYFGSLSLIEGRKDVNGLYEGLQNLGSDGKAFPIRPLGSTWRMDPDPGHSHGASVEQWGQGKNDGFVKNFETRIEDPAHADRRDWVMGYHQRAELPALYTLADHFALFDQWHCALLGPTWPNRFYSHCATSEGMWKNDMTIKAPSLYPTLMERGHSFGIYSSTLIHPLMLIESLDPKQYNQKDMPTFYLDAAAGNLPNVTIVEADYVLSDDHPPNDIRQGELFIASVYEALRKSAKWDRTLFLVFYDEHGGLYDHVAPPKAAFDERAAEGFDQLGFRIPAVAAGGLVRRGESIHTLIDHSSVPGLLSRIFELPFLNQRSELAGDIGTALSLDLRRDKLRPEAPPMPQIEALFQDLDQAHMRPFGQAELLDFAVKRGLTTRDGWRPALRKTHRDMADIYEKLGIVKWG